MSGTWGMLNWYGEGETFWIMKVGVENCYYRCSSTKAASTLVGQKVRVRLSIALVEREKEKALTGLEYTIESERIRIYRRL